MKVFCYAYEGMYQGLHGIESMCVMEVSDDLEKAGQEIDEWGRYESEDLIYSYGLEDDYMNEFDEDDEEVDITESNYYCERGWYAHKIREDIDLSVEELDAICCKLGKDSFIEEYCEENVLG